MARFAFGTLRLATGSPSGASQAGSNVEAQANPNAAYSTFVLSTQEDLLSE